MLCTTASTAYHDESCIFSCTASFHTMQDQLKEEVMNMAKKIGAANFNLLVIDTENKARAGAGWSAVRLWPVVGNVPDVLTNTA